MARSKSFRQIRKILRRQKEHLSVQGWGHLALRIISRLCFKGLRFFVYFCFRLWLRKVHNPENLPQTGPAIIVSNHLSYFDWAVLSAVYWNRYLVFIGNRDLLNRGFVGWLMKLNILIFIDPLNPGLAFYKESLRRLDEARILVIYPEGSRSKSGRMLEPRTGFIKLALRTNAPVIPIGMKGTFRILPPHKSIPRPKRCEIFVGKPVFINRRNPLFRDLFKRSGGRLVLSEEGEKLAAVRVMTIIKEMTGQSWEDPGSA